MMQGFELKRTVFFVGFMGAGKTTTARKLARLAGLTAVDMDTYLQRREGKTVKQIFAEVGEEGFRRIETDVLRELGSGEPQLVSCGGGVVLMPENRQILKEAGFVVYLQVTAREAASRISNFESRPLFGDLENAQRVASSREALYQEVADVSIDTAGRGTNSIASQVFDVLKKEGILWPRES